MLKFYCDRCGKDITNEEHMSLRIDYIGSGDASGKVPDEYDICSECLQKLNEFLEPLQISEYEGKNESNKN